MRSFGRIGHRDPDNPLAYRGPEDEATTVATIKKALHEIAGLDTAFCLQGDVTFPDLGIEVVVFRAGIQNPGGFALHSLRQRLSGPDVELVAVSYETELVESQVRVDPIDVVGISCAYTRFAETIKKVRKAMKSGGRQALLNELRQDRLKIPTDKMDQLAADLEADPPKHSSYSYVGFEPPDHWRLSFSTIRYGLYKAGIMGAEDLVMWSQ